MTKEKKYIIYGIVAIMIVVIGTTLAYFAAKIVGDTKPISVTTANLRIIFNNGDGTITGTDLEPGGYDETKTFSIQNDSNTEYKYNIIIKDLVNTFVTEGYLVYKITNTSNNGGYSMTEFKDIPKSSSARDAVLAYNISIPAGVTQEYSIQIKYLNDADVNQSEDMEKEVTGKLFISEGSYPTLAKLILRDNPTISERTDFSITNTADTTGTIYQTNKTEDGSTVYYYSGNTTKNWVHFGGFYWRIIRTNEDGSVRLLYAGTNHDTTSGYIGLSKFNENYNDPMYSGYMYGTSGSLENNRTNTNDSTIKTFIDKWYEDTLLTNYDKYISKTAIYCHDRSISSNQTYSTSDYFEYGGYTRLNKDGNDLPVPTYKCGGNGTDGLFESAQAIADKFSASTTGGGNGQLKYPIAMMTADELSFAGGLFNNPLSSPYAWYYTNSQGESITGNSWWWSLSPSDWYDSNAYAWHLMGSDSPGYLSDDCVQLDLGVRPSVSLASCVGIKSGNGTPESPYEIDESSCS